jgi:hypothetical protein
VQPAALQAIERFTNQFTAETCEAIRQSLRCIARIDFERAREQHRSGIESLLHAHDRNAGDAVAGEDRALDRRRAAPARQQRGVNVEATQARNRERLRRQDQSIGRNDERVDIEVAQ